MNLACQKGFQIHVCLFLLVIWLIVQNHDVMNEKAIDLLPLQSSSATDIYYRDVPKHACMTSQAIIETSKSDQGLHCHSVCIFGHITPW